MSEACFLRRRKNLFAEKKYKKVIKTKIRCILHVQKTFASSINSFKFCVQGKNLCLFTVLHENYYSRFQTQRQKTNTEEKNQKAHTVKVNDD